MKYKAKVESNLDGISNQLTSLKNLVQNNNISVDQLTKELGKLAGRIDEVNELVALEYNDFSVLPGVEPGMKRM